MIDAYSPHPYSYADYDLSADKEVDFQKWFRETIDRRKTECSDSIILMNDSTDEEE